MGITKAELEQTSEYQSKKEALKLLVTKELELRELKINLNKKRKKEMSLIEKRFTRRIDQIQQDIDKFQRMAQAVFSKKEYKAFKDKILGPNKPKTSPGRPKKVRPEEQKPDQQPEQAQQEPPKNDNV